jgi:hypothetical protein
VNPRWAIRRTSRNHGLGYGRRGRYRFTYNPSSTAGSAVPVAARPLVLTCCTTRRARKPHRCIECDETITPGTLYDHWSTKWEGEVSSHSTCLGCSAWGLALAKAQLPVCGCSGWELGSMWQEVEEFAREHLDYDPKTGEEFPRPRKRKPSVVVADVEMGEGGAP